LHRDYSNLATAAAPTAAASATAPAAATATAPAAPAAAATAACGTTATAAAICTATHPAVRSAVAGARARPAGIAAAVARVTRISVAVTRPTGDAASGCAGRGAEAAKPAKLSEPAKASAGGAKAWCVTAARTCVHAEVPTQRGLIHNVAKLVDALSLFLRRDDSLHATVLQGDRGATSFVDKHAAA
jgi:hypothetical protein